MSGATRVAIIGCGFGGLAAAIELKRSGVADFTVYEKAASAGGVWRENTYPGAACDVPSPIYSFSYALKPDWSALFGQGHEIKNYLDTIVDEFGLREHIRFGTEVVAATFDADYPMLCNRLLLSNDWYPTLGRDNVHLVGSAVEQVTHNGIVTADGTKVEADVLIWCSGFKASEFLAPIRITGRDGRDLHEQWKHGAEAYLGMSAPGFPNMFMLFGPNTNSITNSIVFLLERQAAYIRTAVEYKHASRHGWIDIRQDVHDSFQEWLQRKLAATVFTDNCPGWYTNAEGKVTAMWPLSHLSYARATRRFHPERYLHHPSGQDGRSLVNHNALTV